MNTDIGKDIAIAKQFLDHNELVAIPTETVYGLAANAFSAEAISKIYHVKNRPSFNPLILHVGNKNELTKFLISIPKKMEALIDTFMPGPLTILLPKTDIISDLTTAGSQKLAIRIPNNELTLSLLESLDYPLAAPSANISGYVSPTKPEHVYQSLKGKIPYILDGGDCLIGIESTIVGYDFTKERVLIHRLGGLGVEQIEDKINENVELRISHTSPETPGQLKSHYATKTPLEVGAINDLILKYDKKKILIINFSAEKNVPAYRQYVLSINSNVNEAAQNLFATLRMADEENADIILSEWAPNIGLGMAINDRLRRAST